MRLKMSPINRYLQLEKKTKSKNTANEVLIK